MYLNLFEYLETCHLLEGQKFNFDYIGEEPIQYSITIPTNTPEIAMDTLGNTKCKLIFYLISVSDFGLDSSNNIQNLDFFLKLREWFDEQNEKKNFPDFGDGKTVTAVIAETDGYIEATKSKVGRYQIQCRVEYIQKNKKIKFPHKF